MSFSLRELQELEQERIDREKKARADREAAALRAREERMRREAEAAAEKERLEAEAREAERRKELEELARREAMQKAVVEQARIEVEARTRAQEAERERRYEMELAAIRAKNATTSPGVLVGGALAGALVVLAGALIVHFGVVEPRSERRVAELAAQSAAAEGRAAELDRRVEEQRTTIERLGRELQSAREAITALETAKPTTTSGPRGPRGGNTPPPRDRRRPVAPMGPDCLDGDPLCPTIRR